MTRDDIISMAREAGIPLDPKHPGWLLPHLERFAALVEEAVADEPCVVLERGDVAMERYLKRIERMKAEGWRQCSVGQSTTQFCGQLEAAVAAEREACARVCESRYMGDNNREDMEAKRCAAAIRARGEE